jgi:hypothetical protein
MCFVVKRINRRETMNEPKRTVKRRTSLPHRGRRVWLIVPPACDYVTVRQEGRRQSYDIDLASIYDLAAKKEALRVRAAKLEARKARAS